MLQRALYPIVFSPEWGRQMRFIAGPRQCGKTTLAKVKLQEEGYPHLYYLWESRAVKNRYKLDELFFQQDEPPGKKKKWVCFDEIHKMPKWKNILKAIFDLSETHYQFIVTGSSKLDIFKKAGDSLAGRYFTFHLFPLSLREVQKNLAQEEVPEDASLYLSKRIDIAPKKSQASALETLLEFGGFPQPFLKQSKSFYTKWADDYLETVVREDIGALTHILNKEYLFDLYRLLPEMIGSPISISSLASHLELSHPTLKSYLRRLEDFYLIFKIYPYFRNIKRAIIKSPKCYLYDWAQIADPGKRFENYVAAELFSQLHLWKDQSGEKFSLFFVRTREKEEIDFLILRRNIPWLLVEAKLTDGPLSSYSERIQQSLGNIPLVQVCREDGVCRLEKKNLYRLSAAHFFA